MQYLQTVLAGVIGAIFVYLGQRVIAKSSKEVGQAQVQVDQRRVDIEAFTKFTSEYDKQLSDVRKQLDVRDTRIAEMGERIERNNRLLVIAVVALRRTRQAFLDGLSIPDFPEQLRDVPTWQYDEELRETERNEKT